MQEHGAPEAEVSDVIDAIPSLADVVEDVGRGDGGIVQVPPAPLAEPQEPEPSAKRQRGPDIGVREVALDSIEFTYGKITWYSGKAAFEARCTKAEHNIGSTCKMTRGVKARKWRDGCLLEAGHLHSCWLGSTMQSIVLPRTTIGPSKIGN